MKRSAHLDALPPAPPETLRQRATYWQYRTVWEAVARLPAPLARRLPDRAGRLWYRMAGDRQRSQVRANLARLVGEVAPRRLDGLVEEAYVAYARYWVDAFRLHRMNPREVMARTVEDNLDALQALIDTGRGAILATAHLGSWDIGAAFTSQRGWHLAVVAELLEPRRLFEEFVRLREQAGLEVYPLVEGGDTIDRMQQVIAEGGVPTLLADRDLTGRGPVVEFFGEPCRLPPGPAVLARRTGRPVAVGAFVTEGPEGWRAVIEDVVDVSDRSVGEGTQVVAHALEGLIGRFPEQWHVFVPNWLADREPDHPRLAGATTDGDPDRAGRTPGPPSEQRR